MEAKIEQLMAQGYTAEEAALIDHVVGTARAETVRALRTGMCRCGRRLRKMHSTLECLACGHVHAA